MNLVKTGKTPLHGKIVAWGDDVRHCDQPQLGVRRRDPDFPRADIGIHINASGIAAATMARLRRLFSELTKDTSHPDSAVRNSRRPAKTTP